MHGFSSQWLKGLGLLFALLSFEQVAFAGERKINFNSDFIINGGQKVALCDGTLQIDVLLADGGGSYVDEWDWCQLQIRESGTSNWKQIAGWGSNVPIVLGYFDGQPRNEQARNTHYGPSAPQIVFVEAKESTLGIFDGMTVARTQILKAAEEDEWVRITLTNIPKQFSSFDVRVYGSFDGVTETGDKMGYPVQILSAPILTQVSNNQCEQVEIGWSNPFSTGSCNTAFNVEVYRNDTLVHTETTGATNYVDPLAGHGIKADYKLRTVSIFNGGAYKRYSAFSAEREGETKAAPVAVDETTLRAGNDLCNAIKVNWQWTGGVPKNFGIKVFEQVSGVQVDDNLSISGVANSYTFRNGEDFNIDPTKKYKFEVFAINECTKGPSKTVMNGALETPPTAPNNFVAQTAGEGLKFTWDSTSSNHTAFVLQRSFFGGGGVSRFEIPSNQTSYTDQAIEVCQRYQYEILAVNQCALDGIGDQVLDTFFLPDLSTAFDTDKKLVASKGYYGNKVDLNWVANLSDFIDEFKIFRKALGSAEDSVQITSVAGALGNYADLNAEAGVLYEYFIIGKTNCAGKIRFTNISSDVGFRLPVGVISGQITYEGGFAVKGAKVLAETSTGNSGKSLMFNGSNRVEVPSVSAISPAGKMFMEAWVRPTELNSGTYKILDKSGAYTLRIVNSKLELVVIDGSGATHSIIQDSSLALNTYQHVSGGFDGDSLILFVGGVQVKSKALTGSLKMTNSPLTIGAGFKGNIDEVRMWNEFPSKESIFQNKGRYLVGSETGLVLYLTFDEGSGDKAYDRSKDGTSFNKHHGELLLGPEWSSEIPSTNLLGTAAYTDATGGYTIVLYYPGTGATYKVTPAFPQHSFNPAQQPVTIGEGNNVYNGLNFIDESSFPFSGTVFYDTTDVPVGNVAIYLDGEPMYSSTGEPVKSDASGAFSGVVPIGEHYFSAVLEGHTFSEGRFPPTGNFNFQSEKNGIAFIDDTKRKIVGRVVGGNYEMNKPLINSPKKSHNNVGVAEITFKSAIGNLEVTVSTDSESGYYEVFLPPTDYIIPDFKVTNQPDKYRFSGVDDLKITDLGPNLIYAVDTIIVGGDTTIDSNAYHRALNFPIQSEPEIFVYAEDGTSAFLGDDYVKFQGEKLAISPSSLPYPCFTQNAKYSVKIKARESYENKDSGSPIIKTYDVTSGILRITNSLAQKDNITINLQSADTTYSFIAGAPSKTTGSPAKYNYTKTFKVVLETINGTAEWKPRTANYTHFDGTEDYRGYIFGTVLASGQSFASIGPFVVSHVLRDPFGSDSYAYFEESSSTSTVVSYETSEDESDNFSTQIAMGTSFEVTALGYSTDVDVVADADTVTETTTSVNEAGEFEETITFTQTIETSSDAAFTGAESDVFIGRAMNTTFGVGEGLEVVLQSDCPSLDCVIQPGPAFIKDGKGYNFVLRKSFMAVPGGYETMFAVTELTILTSTIPKLEEIRNNILTSSPGVYASKLPASDPRFGKNNDDLVFGSEATGKPLKTEKADYDGPSYTYTQPGSKADTIRILNQQIRLWQEAIANNEKAKVTAFKTQVPEVHEFGYGATKELSKTVSNTNSTTYTFETIMDESTRSAFGAETAGAGLTVEMGASISVTNSESESSVATTETTYGYRLEDGDEGDEFMVAVYDSKNGSGPIFQLQGGKSMCPYEGPEMTKFYKENGSSVELSPGSLKRENPKISVETASFAIKKNVPSDQPAVFQLELMNESVTGDQQLYNIRIMDNSNPHGAVVLIDGIDPAREFSVGSGQTTYKTLTIDRGPIEFKYDSIGIILHSQCQYGVGTSSELEIADTIYVSAHFIPECTDANLLEPLNQFVINNSFNDSVEVLMNDYDINYHGFKKLHLEYKKSSSSTWKNLSTWYVDTTGMNDSTLVPIPTERASTFYIWELNSPLYPDGYWDIRTSTECKFFGLKDPVYSYSPKFSGIIDRIDPHPFGNPQPADGILSPNDEIMIQFNEPIDLGTIIPSKNFKISGVLNGEELRHDASVSFNGVNSYARLGGVIPMNRSLTIEMWVKRERTGLVEVLFSQGINEEQSIRLGFNSSNQLEAMLAGKKMVSVQSISDNKWHHVAWIYNEEEAFAKWVIDGIESGLMEDYFADFTEGGDVFVGKNSVVGSEFQFQGSIHDLRVWNKALAVGDVSKNHTKTISNRALGLLANFPMDEVPGDAIIDRIKNRVGTLYNTQWSIEPKGNAFTLNGSNFFQLNTNTHGINMTQEMDFTIEFWVKGNPTGSDQTFFSTGHRDSSYSWVCFADAGGQLKLIYNGQSYDLESQVLNGTWNHVSLVMDRTANLNCYINGNLSNGFNSNQFGPMSSTFFWIGTEGWVKPDLSVGATNHLIGKLDEVRVWNLSRKQKQIARDAYHKLNGTDFGLVTYVPFENEETVVGVVVQNPSLLNVVNDSTLNLVGDSLFEDVDVPVVKMPRLVTEIQFGYSVNGDKIIFTPTTDAAKIENVTLDVTVKGIKDLQGNVMQSPKTWIAYVDRNQLVWELPFVDLSVELNHTTSFKAKVLNLGGELKEFTINNLPHWLTCSNTSGSVEPNSYIELEFEVVEGVNIGNYQQGVYLSSDFGFDEVLLVTLDVYAKAPNWEVNTGLYDGTMSVIGFLEVDEIESTDSRDKLAAFIDDSLRGVANLEYFPQYDRYMVFLDVFGYKGEQDSIEFRIWDASVGKIHSQVVPGFAFKENDLIGAPLNPQKFEATTIVWDPIALQKGWNWVSFHLSQTMMNNAALFLKPLTAGQGDIMKDVSGKVIQFTSSGGWNGNLDSLKNGEGYKMKISEADTLVYEGVKIDFATFKMPLVKGWNWIGGIALRNLTLEEAFSEIDVPDQTLLKGQSSFAVYDSIQSNWVGSLGFIEPKKGYMLLFSKADTLKYPNADLLFTGRFEGPKPYAYKEVVNPADFQFSMSVIAKNPECPSGDGWSLTARMNNEIRGKAQNKDGLFFMTVFSNESNESIEFYWENANGEEFPVLNTMDFESNGLVGSLKEPLLLEPSIPLGYVGDPCEVDRELGIQENRNKLPWVYPTLIHEQFTLNFEDQLGKGNILLYNVHGANVFQWQIQSHQNEMQFEMPSFLNEGVYFLSIPLEDGTYHQIKIVRVK